MPPRAHPWGTPLQVEISCSWAPVKTPRGQTLRSPRPNVTSAPTRLQFPLKVVRSLADSDSAREGKRALRTKLGKTEFSGKLRAGKCAGSRVGRSNRNLELYALQTSSLHPRSHWSQYAAFPDMRIFLMIWSSDRMVAPSVSAVACFPLRRFAALPVRHYTCSSLCPASVSANTALREWCFPFRRPR